MSSVQRPTDEPTQNPEEIKVVAAILAKTLNLSADRVLINYERWQVPKSGLFISVGALGDGEQIAARSRFDAAVDAEVQETLVLQEVQVDLMSIIPDDSARRRRWEVPLGLQSFWARAYAGKYGVGLPRLVPRLQDTSVLEPGGYLNRYTTRFSVGVSQSRTLPASSFTSFPVQLTTAQTGSSTAKTKTIPMEEP